MAARSSVNPTATWRARLGCRAGTRAVRGAWGGSRNTRWSPTAKPARGGECAPACRHAQVHLSIPGTMRLPGSLLRVAGAFLVAGVAASPALAVPRYELAVRRIRAPARVKLDDRQQTATGRAAVRIANRGSAPAVFADAAALTAAVRLTADALKGPIICAPVGIAPAVAQRRFPLTVRPGQSRALRYD